MTESCRGLPGARTVATFEDQDGRGVTQKRRLKELGDPSQGGTPVRRQRDLFPGGGRLAKLDRQRKSRIMNGQTEQVVRGPRSRGKSTGQPRWSLRGGWHGLQKTCAKQSMPADVQPDTARPFHRYGKGAAGRGEAGDNPYPVLYRPAFNMPLCPCFPEGAQIHRRDTHLPCSQVR